MIELVARERAGISALCERYGVRRLDLFGSAARETDFTEHSDIDLLIAYEPKHHPPALRDYFALREGLSALLHRPVDLVMEKAVKNPYIRANIEATRRPLYGA